MISGDTMHDNKNAKHFCRIGHWRHARWSLQLRPLRLMMINISKLGWRNNIKDLMRVMHNLHVRLIFYLGKKMEVNNHS